ncbi:MAG TPA: hypothetical protein VHN14_23030 [Kofleriaceae bacterium]|jgi:hypothetical protein|nr:hypothetical protein [Kofleriaceae bacterium]
MSLANRVHQHPWVSSVLGGGLALGVLGITACGAGRLGEQKVATAGGFLPSAPSAHARAVNTYDGPSYAANANHAAIESRGEPMLDRPGLGTSWGEAVAAPISFSPFMRSNSSPWAEVVLHYNDVAGVTAHAQYLGTRPAPLEVQAGDGALSVALVDEAGGTLPGFTASGRTLIMGEDGQRYRIVVRNATAARFEVVASVDGLDVIDGQPADPNRRGYIVDPYGMLTIDGFRTSEDVVAAFRFGNVADSYAAQTSGDRNVGVVGMAIFAERGVAWTPDEIGRRDTADPFPQRGYAMPPR